MTGVDARGDRQSDVACCPIKMSKTPRGGPPGGVASDTTYARTSGVSGTLGWTLDRDVCSQRVWPNHCLKTDRDLSHVPTPRLDPELSGLLLSCCTSMVMKVEDCPRPRGETCRPGVVSDPYGRPHRPKSPLLGVSSVSAANPQHRSDAADQIFLHRRDRRGPRRPGSPQCTPQTPHGRRGAMVRRTQQRQLAIRDRRPRGHAVLLTGRCDGTRCAVALLRRASRAPVSVRARE